MSKFGDRTLNHNLYILRRVCSVGDSIATKIQNKNRTGGKARASGTVEIKIRFEEQYPSSSTMSIVLGRIAAKYNAGEMEGTSEPHEYPKASWKLVVQ